LRVWGTPLTSHFTTSLKLEFNVKAEYFSDSVGQEALNNEFFAKACLEWKERLADG